MHPTDAGLQRARDHSTVSVWGAIAGAAIDIGGKVGGYFAEKEASEQQNKRRKQTQKKAYQWTMEDMRAAGLNPILAYQQGPTSAGGVNMTNVPDMGGIGTSAAGSKAALEGATAKTKQTSIQDDLVRGQLGLMFEQKQRERAAASAAVAQAGAADAQRASTLQNMRFEASYFPSRQKMLENAAIAASGTAKQSSAAGVRAEALEEYYDSWIGKKATQAGAFWNDVNPMIKSGSKGTGKVHIYDDGK